MGILFSEPECRVCGDCGRNYDNPLLKFYHIGKYNGLMLCMICYTKRFERLDKYLEG